MFNKRIQELEEGSSNLQLKLDEVQGDKERIYNENKKLDTINEQHLTNIVTLKNNLQKKEIELKNFETVIANLNENIMEKEKECN